MSAAGENVKAAHADELSRAIRRNTHPLRGPRGPTTDFPYECEGVPTVGTDAWT